jgi:hypothetical protein
MRCSTPRRSHAPRERGHVRLRCADRGGTWFGSRLGASPAPARAWPAPGALHRCAWPGMERRPSSATIPVAAWMSGRAFRRAASPIGRRGARRKRGTRPDRRRDSRDGPCSRRHDRHQRSGRPREYRLGAWANDRGLRRLSRTLDHHPCPTYPEGRAVDRTAQAAGSGRPTPRSPSRARATATDSARTYARAAASIVSVDTPCPAPTCPATSTTTDTSPSAS